MKRRGVGIGTMLYGMGFGFGRPDISSAYVEIAEDGSATLVSGAVEIGQGAHTVLCQIVAEELGIPYEAVRIVAADTASTPDAGPSTASRQTFVSGNAVKKAAADAKREILNLAAQLLEVNPEDLVVREGTISMRDVPSISLPFAKAATEAHRRGRRFAGFGWQDITTKDVDHETSQGDAYATFLYAAQLAEVEVDIETGEVKVLRLVSATDVGKAINPQAVQGQIQGGGVMGLGYTLTENMVIQDGQLKSNHFHEYLIPTSLDAPEIVPFIVEEPDPNGPFGAKGVGEAAIIPTASAILDAIYDAIGVRLTRLPATPENVLAAIREERAKQP